MILVTVGTTMPFDELLAEVDHCVATGVFDESVLCQSGQSAYRMQFCEQFRGRPTLDDLIAESSMVITHGGATVIQLLIARKAFIAFPNPRGAGDHQTSFLRQVAKVSDISWSRNPLDLARLFRERSSLGPALLRAGYPRVDQIIREILPTGPLQAPP